MMHRGHIVVHHHHHHNGTTSASSSYDDDNTLIMNHHQSQQQRQQQLIRQHSSSSAFSPFTGVTYNRKRKTNNFTCQNVTTRITAGCKQLYHQIQMRELPAYIHQNQQVLTDTATGAMILPQNPSQSFPLLFARYRFVRQIAKGGFSQIILAEDTFASTTSLSGSNNNDKNNNNNHHHTTGTGQSNSDRSNRSWTPTKRVVAIKIMSSKWSSIGEEESKMLRRLYRADPSRSANICHLYHTFYFQQHFCLVFELLGDTLLTKTRHYTPGSVSLRHIRKSAAQLLGALCLLKNEGMIHADLKPENILLKHSAHKAESKSGISLKVVDFGNAIDYRSGDVKRYYKEFKCQTLSYRAPEVIFGMQFDYAIDMWSLGVVLVELYIGKPLFPCSESAALISSMQTLLGPIPHKLFSSGKLYGRYFPNLASNQIPDPYSKQKTIGKLCLNLKVQDVNFCSFIQGLLNYNPEERMTPEQALRHPFLSSLFPFSAVIGPPIPTVSPPSVPVTKDQHNKTLPFQSPSQSPLSVSASNSQLSIPSTTSTSILNTPTAAHNHSMVYDSFSPVHQPRLSTNSQSYIVAEDHTAVPVQQRDPIPVVRPAPFYRETPIIYSQPTNTAKRKYEETFSSDDYAIAMAESKRARTDQYAPNEQSFVVPHNIQTSYHDSRIPDSSSHSTTHYLYQQARSDIVARELVPPVPQSVVVDLPSPILHVPSQMAPPVSQPVSYASHHPREQQLVKTTMTATTMIQNHHTTGTAGLATSIPYSAPPSLPDGSYYHHTSDPTMITTPPRRNNYTHYSTPHSAEPLHAATVVSPYYHHHPHHPPPRLTPLVHSYPAPAVPVVVAARTVPQHEPEGYMQPTEHVPTQMNVVVHQTAKQRQAVPTQPPHSQQQQTYYFSN